METAACWQVHQLDNVPILNISWWAKCIPRKRPIYWLALDVERLRDILNEPDVVLVFMGVEGDLLLLASRWIHQVVGVQVPPLSVVMSDADSASESDINRDILHAFRVESSLEFGAHESVSITRVNEADEVDSKHGQVECKGYDNQTEDTSNQMLRKYSLYRLAKVCATEVGSLPE